ncbi:MAG: OmpA family protein [Burkholderiales bacterium]|nr:MAG: OmpA family protein [Burkholderiales bacterium]
MGSPRWSRKQREAATAAPSRPLSDWEPSLVPRSVGNQSAWMGTQAAIPSADQRAPVMKKFRPLLVLSLCGLTLSASVAAQTPEMPPPAASATGAVDLGKTVPSADAINEGLFPDDKCKELEANGFKCMGFKPAVKYSLPATSFKVGSAELPATLKKQLDVFADVLKTKKNAERKVRVIGHADASGTPQANQALSMKRAESVRDYLVSKGTDPALLVIEGVGSQDPKNPGKPNSGENRRVEIGRK